MKLLLDTHILLWSTLSPNRLSHAARILIKDARNEVVFSSANIWEVAIKHALGRPGFAVEPVSLRRDCLPKDGSSFPSMASTEPWPVLSRRSTRTRSTES